MKDDEVYRARHRERMSYMPYLYHEHLRSDRPHLRWIADWQRELQAEWTKLETIRFGENCFVAPSAHLFGEPHRGIEIGDESTVAADVFLHGPVRIGRRTSLNPGVHVDGGRAGVTLGNDVRVAAGVKIYAFDHGIAPETTIREQAVRSLGITVGDDVWIGANVCITDGVTVGDHAVLGMGAVVARDVPEWAIVGGVPARILGDRRNWPPQK